LVLTAEVYDLIIEGEAQGKGKGEFGAEVETKIYEIVHRWRNWGPGIDATKLVKNYIGEKQLVPEDSVVEAGSADPVLPELPLSIAEFDKRKGTFPQTLSCDGCFQISLEAIYFAYHPLSKWTGMGPNDAVHLIKECLAEDWDVLTFAAPLQGDHATDDLDPTLRYNRKIESVSTILKLVPRMQEIKLGDVKFRNAESHAPKELVEGDYIRNTNAIRELIRSRTAATVAYARNLDVKELLEFTEPLRDPVHGGTNFNLRDFLYAVLPYWESRAKDHTPAACQLVCPIAKTVAAQVNQLLQGKRIIGATTTKMVKPTKMKPLLGPSVARMARAISKRRKVRVQMWICSLRQSGGCTCTSATIVTPPCTLEYSTVID
jgi:hypothetical protein